MGVCLGDGDPDGDPEGADEAEGGEVGEEQRLLDPGLPELQTHAERDHKLVTRDGCNTRLNNHSVYLVFHRNTDIFSSVP